jgi:hypothetical protein
MKQHEHRSEIINSFTIDFTDKYNGCKTLSQPIELTSDFVEKYNAYTVRHVIDLTLAA